MFQNLDIMQTSAAMARHAGARQAITATNMANADTPGYRAMRMAPFADTYRPQSPDQMKTTRQGHRSVEAAGQPSGVVHADAEAAPNGNSVSLEQEMVSAVEIQREHSRALAIYKHSLDVLRMSIGRR